MSFETGLPIVCRMVTIFRLRGILFRPALRGLEAIQTEEVVFEAPDGRKINCLINAKAIHTERGELVSAVGTILDMTPLEDLKRLRAEFLQNVSHELRTPLSAIKGSTAAILGTSGGLNTAEIGQFLRVIDEQSDYMRNLMNDLVDLTQIETGTLSVNTEPTDVSDLLDKARERCSNGGVLDYHEIELHLPDKLPMVLADEIRIMQVFGNLLTHPSGDLPDSTGIRMSAVPLGEFVEFCVDNEDSGLGTPSIRQGVERYARTGGRSTRRRRGMDDLSISLCKGIVEAHGGRLRLNPAHLGASRSALHSPPKRKVEGTTRKVRRSPLSAGTLKEEGALLVVIDDPDTARSDAWSFCRCRTN